MWPPCVPLDDLPSIFEVEETIKIMSNPKAVRPAKLPADQLRLILDGDRYGNGHILKQFHDLLIAIWRSGSVPQECKNATIRVMHKKKDRTECGWKLPWHLARGTRWQGSQGIANRLSNYCEREDILPEQCGFRPQRSTIDTIFVV